MPPHPKQKMETPKKLFGTPTNRKNNRLCNSPLGREGRDRSISRKAAPSILVLFLLFMGIVACSATLIIAQSVPPQDKTPTEWFYESDTDEQAQDAALTTETTHAATKATTTTEAAPTTTTTTTTTTNPTTTFAEIKAATAKKLRTKATQTTTTTTTTIPCGGDMQPPCQKGVEGCDEGNILGADNICHTPTCAPSVKSGLKGCGAFALRFCQPGQPSYKYLASIEMIDETED